MFSKIRRRFTYANILMTIALVLVMSGGAYGASKYLITSTKQISPKVLKALRGKTGPAGAKGANGANGLNGALGAPGEKGAAGTNGTNGTAGANGTDGVSVTGKALTAGNPNCPEGGSEFTASEGKKTYACDGSPWTAGGVLPSEKSEYGSWSDIGNEENQAKIYTPISFTLPLSKDPLGEEVVGPGQTGAHCTGTSAVPTAPPGYLCVYDQFEVNEKVFHAHFGSFLNPTENLEKGASTVGTLLEVETVDIGEGAPYTIAYGTWTVTSE